MNTWYELTPLDTLFFRGNEPLEAGIGVSQPLFPPPVSVILGAFRTACLVQKGISFTDYKENRVAEEVIATIGRCGEDPPFSVTAILIRKGEELYAPAPAHWFVDPEKKPKKGADYSGLKVLTPSVPSQTLKKLSVVSSSNELPMVVAKNEASSLAGCWVRFELLGREEITLSKGDILTAQELYVTEPRIGIGLKQGKTVEEKKLYSANHIRLRDGVTMVIGFDRHPGMTEKGTIQLGGEQRRSWYRQVEALPIPTVAQPSCYYMTLAPLRAEEPLLSEIVATGRLQTTAGWDLSRGFHKPTVAWFPAGAVFRRRINDSFVSIPH